MGVPYPPSVETQITVGILVCAKKIYLKMYIKNKQLFVYILKYGKFVSNSECETF